MAWGRVRWGDLGANRGYFLALVDAKCSVADVAWEQNRKNNRNVNVIVGFNGSTGLKPINESSLR